MQRIGRAASKMSKGCFWSYNLCVILIATLLSLFIFFISGFSILLIVFLISLILHAVKPLDFHPSWVHMAKISLSILAIVVGIFNLVAIIKNIQFTKNKI